jgi:hypothetical protein
VLQARDNETNLRYRADMRVISAVTLVFLPGTFIATMFSTSFWTSDPSTGGPIVSKWIWVCWTLTAALTAAVLAVWRNFSFFKTTKNRLSSAWLRTFNSWQEGRIVRKLRRKNDAEGLEMDARETTSNQAMHETTSPMPTRNATWRTIKRKRWFKRRRTNDGAPV